MTWDNNDSEVTIDDEAADRRLPPLTEEVLAVEIAGLEEDILNVECGHPIDK